MISIETLTIVHSSMMKFSIDFIVLNANLLISYWHLQILSIAFFLIIVPPYLVCSSMNKRVIFHHSCRDIPTYGALNPQLHPQGSRSDLGLRGINPRKGPTAQRPNISARISSIINQPPLKCISIIQPDWYIREIPGMICIDFNNVPFLSHDYPVIIPIKSK